ncbi:hypothetical protein I4F81_000020 [Pyropia yezoensis]|uniref:Uncharacterized protein n=1 Tax=Pyropia yezoensis TaxID=2788 RepID=A0ACC3BHR2_PYRYE|nr:hypothetical protein I4F81_000020 [Neopyropia yezoensis]
MGEAVGERSAGFLQLVGGVEAYTHRNLVARLFVNKPEIGGRLIQMGSLYSSVQRGGDTPGATAANVGPPPGYTRKPPEREQDSAACVHMVALANYSRGFGLSLINTQAVVVQALHLAENGYYALVGTVTSVVRNHGLQHTVSATYKGSKTTINTYSGAVAAFCRWAAEKSGDDAPVMPISRTTVVSLLEAEKGQRVATRKRARPAEDEDDQPSRDERLPCIHPLRMCGRVRVVVRGQVLLNNVNALSKIAKTLNVLFRDATCECCSRWWREEYASASSYELAVSVCKKRKREKVLEDHAAGASKTLGRRSPSLSDDQRKAAVRWLLLLPTSAMKHRLRALLASLFVLSFSLEARGATAHGIVWSDMVVRQLPAMFSAHGKALDVFST